MNDEIDFESEIASHEKAVVYFRECINKENDKIKSLYLESNNLHDFKKGKLCWFWDSEENNKKVRPMIRPYHHSAIVDKKKRYYSADLEGNIIGHGWKNCKEVELIEIIDRLL
jgi:hypothetical protein